MYAEDNNCKMQTAEDNNCNNFKSIPQSGKVWPVIREQLENTRDNWEWLESSTTKCEGPTCSERILNLLNIKGENWEY